MHLGDDEEGGDDDDAHNPYANPVTYRDLSDQDEGGSSYEEEEEPAAGEEGVAEEEVGSRTAEGQNLRPIAVAESLHPCSAMSTPQTVTSACSMTGKNMTRKSMMMRMTAGRRARSGG